ATFVLCVPTDTNGHTLTATDILCVLTDSHGQSQTSCRCWRTPTNVLCVLNRQPTWAKITQTVHGKGQRAESKDQRADMCIDVQPQTPSTDVLCVLANTHGRSVCTEQTAHRAEMCTDGQPRTSSTDYLCVLTDTHGRPVHPTWAKITRRVHGMGQCAESKEQRADIVLFSRTNVLIFVLMDSHGRPVCADGHTRTHTESHRRPMCADRHTRTSPTDVVYVLTDTHGRPVCTEQTAHSKGRVSVLSPRTNVLICVLMDSHRRPVCADGHTRTAMDDLCVLTDTHGRPVCVDGHPRMSCTAHVGQNHPNSPREGLAC
ncbi:unnamed protein product, partial [Brassica rapa]